MAVRHSTIGLLAIAACLPAVAEESLFDGNTLRGWRETPFKGHGKVSVENGTVVLGSGAPLTGITWAGEFPHSDYELRFDAMRVRGGDFFASVTFPVGDSHCTWVTGGWGGDIVGLSSLDGWDASDNETRAYFTFEEARWHQFRLRVTDTRITAWIDERQIINVEIGGRRIDLRPGEIKLSAPLGFASYNTKGAVRKIEYRLLR